MSQEQFLLPLDGPKRRQVTWYHDSGCRVDRFVDEQGRPGIEVFGPNGDRDPVPLVVMERAMARLRQLMAALERAVTGKKRARIKWAIAQMGGGVEQQQSQ